MTDKKKTIHPTIEGIDLFCGAGGLSYGLATQGVRVVAGIDVDPACQFNIYMRSLCLCTISPIMMQCSSQILRG